MRARIVVSTGARLELADLHEAITVLELKQRVAGAVADLAASQQRVIYRGRVLHDERTLGEVSFQDGDSINIVRGVQPASLPAAATVPAVAAAQGPFGGGALGGMDGDSLKMALNNPLVQQIMSNPETLRAIVLSNPEMRRLVEANPEIGHILSDPAVLRQTVESARNPELMREMMRSSDRAMSNMEAHPEGFNALRRMYTSIQEPLSQIGPSGDRAADDGADPRSSLAPLTEAPNTAALPNPWAPAAPGPQQLPRPPMPALGAHGALASARAPQTGAGGAPFGPLTPGAAGSAEQAGGLGAGGEAPPGGGLFGTLASNPALMASMLEAMHDPAMQAIFGGGGSMAAGPHAAGGGGPLGAGNGAELGGRRRVPDPAALLAGAGQRWAQQPQPQQQHGMLDAMLMQRLLEARHAAGAMPGGALFDSTPAQSGGLFGGPALATMGQPAAQPQQQPHGAAGSPMSDAASRRAAEARYASEIEVVEGMGFDDKDKILDALVATGGNVNAAIGRLLE